MATFRPLTPDKKVDLAQLGQPTAARSLADLLPTAAAPDLPARPAPVATRAQIAGAVVAVLVAGLAVLFMARSVPAAPPAMVSTVAPAIAPVVPTTAAAVLPQSALGALVTLTRPVGAFAAPDGAYLGTIEQGRAYTPTARLGNAWTQIEAYGSGLVWIAARELAPDPALADLAPPTPLPTSPPPPAAPAVVYQAAPPAPTQCATVAGGGVSVQRCGAASADALQAEAQAAWDQQIGRDRNLAVTPDVYGGKRP